MGESQVHSAAVGSAAPTIRYAAHVDDLRLKLSAFKTKFESERRQLQDELRNERKRSTEHRNAVSAELSEAKHQMESLHSWALEQLRGQRDDDDACLRGRRGGS